MYGNGGGFHLPIIDIIQTFNSSSQVCKRPKPLESKPALSSSSKGFSSLRRELEFDRKTDIYVSGPSNRKSVSYGSLYKEMTAGEERSKNQRKLIPPKMKVLKCRQNVSHAGPKFLTCCCDKNGECVGEKKSLQILYKAPKSSNVFDRDEADEEELTFPSLRGPINSSADLKRKGSFADYIRIKKRKRNG